MQVGHGVRSIREGVNLDEAHNKAVVESRKVSLLGREKHVIGLHLDVSHGWME